MALKLKGSTSGFVGLDAPSVAGNNTLILPENSGSAFQLFANDITAGVTTFTTVTVNRNGDLTVPGTISIGGTLTYEDVTSVDSIGIVTARGLSIFGNTTGLSVTGVGTFAGNVSIAENIVHTGDTDTKIKFPSAGNQISFETDGSERVRITSSILGINTTSASISGMSRYLSVSARNVNNGGSALEIVGNRTGSDQTLGVINFVNDASNVAQITAKYQGSTTNGSLQFLTSGSEKLRITSAGLIGINNSSPNLGGGGDGIHIASSGAAEIHLTSTTGSTTTDGFQIQMSGTTANFINRESGITRFYTGGAGSGNERLRIGSSGQIGIGGANYGTAGQVLQSNGSSSAISWANPVTPHAFVIMDSQYFTSTSTILQFNSNTSNDKSFGVTIDRTNERFKPTVAGVYHVIGILEFNHAGPGASTFTLGLLKNGSSAQVMRRLINYNGGFYDHITVQGMISFNGSSDYVDMRADHNAGGNAIMTTNSTLSMHRVGS